jgi:hypothetical protein
MLSAYGDSESRSLSSASFRSLIATDIWRPVLLNSFTMNGTLVLLAFGNLSARSESYIVQLAPGRERYLTRKVTTILAK